MSKAAIGGSTPECVLTVPRHRLPTLSDDDRIVVVVAPAGYGKTTLAASWYGLNSGSDRAAWITVDKAWRDPSYFVQALLRETGLTGDARAESVRQGATIDDALNALLTQLASRPERSSLFFDDVHELRGSESAAHIARLLTKVPRNVRLVLCGRDAIGLDLSARTTRGLVRWVTKEQLAFEPDDVRRLAGIQGRAIGEESVDRVLETTEGWPALVQLALSIPSTYLAGGESGLLLEENRIETMSTAKPSKERPRKSNSASPAKTSKSKHVR